MPRTLYISEISPPARAAWMCCRAAGVDVEIKEVSVMEGETRKEWFVKMNPNHCVPTLDDDGFIMWESRAVMRYVMNAYAPDSDLYPKDPRRRALVDRALDRDLSTVYKHIHDYIHKAIFVPDETADQKALKDALNDLNTNTPLSESKYITGDGLTIADISTASTLAMLELVEYDLSAYPNIVAWVGKIKAQPFYGECNEGYERFKALFKNEEFRQNLISRQKARDT